MKYLIVSSHPYDGSFNAGVVDTICETVTAKGNQVKVIDLIKDGFDPVMKMEDLSGFAKGAANDPLAIKYQKDIEEADVLVFPFPIWWAGQPAVLKGFVDKVFLPGFAYKFDESHQMIGLLKPKKAVVISTMETPMHFFEDHFRNPIKGSFIQNTLENCGLDVLKYFQFDRMSSGGREYTDARMEEIKDFFSKM